MAAAGASKWAERWGTLRKQLEGRPAGDGPTLDPAREAQLDAMLAGAASQAPGVCLAAASWKVDWLGRAWKKEEAAGRGLSGGEGGGGPGSEGGRGGGGSRSTGLAVRLWAAVAAVVRSGLLAPGSGVTDGPRLAAVATSQKAMQLLQLTACAQHVAALAAGRSGEVAEAQDKGKGKAAKVAPLTALLPCCCYCRAAVAAVPPSLQAAAAQPAAARRAQAAAAAAQAPTGRVLGWATPASSCGTAGTCCPGRSLPSATPGW